jgi:uncharacterized protein YkwD/uncharacterized membrane protein required for colicin V production
MNWIDAIIIVLIIIFIILGLRRGFLTGFVELSGIIISIAIPLLLYIPFGVLLERFGISRVYSGTLGFAIIFLIALSIFFAVSGALYKKIPARIISSKPNMFFGLFTGFLKGLITSILILSFFTVLPLPLGISREIEKSYLGSRLLKPATAVTTLAANIFGDAIRNAVGFITIETDTPEVINLDFSVENPEINEEVELEMLKLINKDRSERGLSELIMDDLLREVARDHSIDMLRRGYFSHVDPEGRTLFDRLVSGGVLFILAGENLAFAPTVSIAHQGLMDSPGHRENILNPQFSRIGIGAASSPLYGIIFTQNFTD